MDNEVEEEDEEDCQPQKHLPLQRWGAKRERERERERLKNTFALTGGDYTISAIPERTDCCLNVLPEVKSFSIPSTSAT